MAKSPTEQIRELSQDVRALLERDTASQRVISRLLSQIDTLEGRVTALAVENAALRQQLADHLAQYQEADRRRWGLFVLMLGAIMSLASGLIATLAKK